jgi:glycosyltransferase involved in cell wall biosynthesis
MKSDKPECSPDQPLVTVCVTSYNNAKFVLETLDSIANQTYKNIELLINDDASTDDSVNLINDWIKIHSEINASLLLSETNLGICKAGNNILRKAAGKYVCLIGSDDRYLPEFISKRVKLLEGSDSSVGLCYSMTYIIDSEGKRIGEESRPKNPSGIIFDHIATGYGSFCKPFTTIIKTDCFKRIGYYDESLLYEDWDWYLRVSKVFKILFFDSFDCEYRNTPDSLGKQLYSEAGVKSQFLIIKKNVGYNKIADKNFKRRLLKLATKAMENNFEVAPLILKYSIKEFYGMKELGLLCAYFLHITISGVRKKRNVLP